jgi:hypothetical protein
MTNPIISIDISEILKELADGQKKILSEIADLKIGQAKLDGNIKALDERLSQKIDGLSTRLGILESKTTLQINWFLAIITGLIGGVLAFLFRSFPPHA